MENASKALIIAGAILLSILLISLGIMVYNQAKGTINEADLSTEEVQTFNTKFTTYAGASVSGTKVNALMDAVAASNGSSSNKVLVKQGSNVYGPAGASVTLKGTTTPVTVTNNNQYPTFSRNDKIKVEYSVAEDGRVCLITVTILP